MQHALSNANVTDNLALESVAEAGSPGELANFANIMEDGPGHQKIWVYFWVERDDGATDTYKSDDVLEQATYPRVVQALGRWRGLIGGCDLCVVEEGEDKTPKIGVGELLDISAQLGPHLVDIEAGYGEVV